MKILVTGCAGFIGMHVAARLLDLGHDVEGLDNFDPYYDVALKEARLARLSGHARFRFSRLDIADPGFGAWFEQAAPQRVVHLAAQPGVRYSLENPHAYVRANLAAFVNMLEACRHGGVEHLVYASSSSVYGGNMHMPFSERDSVDHPVSLYAATKKANELMAHTYSHLFGLPTTGLRFFTVYGPWGRPDMSPTLFARAIFEGRPLAVHNHGDMQRDFTYVDDVVEGVVRVLARAAAPDPAYDALRPDPGRSNAPYRVYNIGNQQPVRLTDYIAEIERAAGRRAVLELKPMQAGDVLATCADTAELARDFGYTPATPLASGVVRFVDWVKSYYGYA